MTVTPQTEKWSKQRYWVNRQTRTHIHNARYNKKVTFCTLWANQFMKTNFRLKENLHSRLRFCFTWCQTESNILLKECVFLMCTIHRYTFCWASVIMVRWCACTEDTEKTTATPAPGCPPFCCLAKITQVSTAVPPDYRGGCQTAEFFHLIPKNFLCADCDTYYLFVLSYM